ncbi:MAG: hypothetical protein NT085_02575 [candidate division SR1 bacterium]|nr:hypothetical protein [candidate division SR1 bacterium]
MEVNPRLFAKKEGDKFHRVWGELIIIEGKEYTPGIVSAELFNSSEEAKRAFHEKYPDLDKTKLN